MNKIKILLITMVFLSAVSICQAQEKESLEAKLAKLEAATKAEQSPQATEAKSVCKKKTLAERIDELEAQQKKMQKVDNGMGIRISTLETKLVALETQSKQPSNSNEALVSKIAELEQKVAKLQGQSELPQAHKALDSEVTNVVAKLDSGIQTPQAQSDMYTEKLPVIKVAELSEDAIGFDITADYFGKYVWRGQNLSDDPVFQPGVSMAIGGLTAAWWGSMDTTKINGNSGEFVEHDWSLDYSDDVPFLKGAGYSVGVINYYFPSGEDTTEVYWGLGFDLPLGPSVTVYHDIDEIKGTYASFGIGHSIERIAELTPDMPIGMDIGASLGWGSASYNKGYWSSDTKSISSSKLNDLVLSLSFPVEIAGWTATPSLNYVTLINGSIRKTDTFNQASDYFFAGIGISKSF